MTAIDGTGASQSLPTWKGPKHAAAGVDSAVGKSATAGGPGESDGRSDPTPVLSSAVYGTLTRDRAQSVASSAPVPSASLIVAADILALDIVRALDANHNGTLSKSEIAALSPIAAAASDSLDTNRDGQLSVGELAQAMLQGFPTFLA